MAQQVELLQSKVEIALYNLLIPVQSYTADFYVEIRLISTMSV